MTNVRYCAPGDAGRIIGAAVVIDVLRAFTTAAWILAGGTSELLLAATDEQALALKRARPSALAVKDGAPASGFDLVNSPRRVSIEMCLDIDRFDFAMLAVDRGTHLKLTRADGPGRGRATIRV